MPEAVAREHQAIGVDFEGTRLVVAFADPGDDEAVQAVGAATGYEIIPAAAGRYEIQHAIDSVFGPDRCALPSLDERESTRSRTRPRASTSTSCSDGARAAGLGPPPHRGQPAGDPRARRAAAVAGIDRSTARTSGR